MSPYVCDCTNVVYMFCVYCIYYYVNKFDARSSFSTSHLNITSLTAIGDRCTGMAIRELCGNRDGIDHLTFAYNYKAVIESMCIS